MEPIQDIEMKEDLKSQDIEIIEENITKKASNSSQLKISNNIIIPDSIPLIENSDEKANLNFEINLSYMPNFNIDNIDELDYLEKEYSPLLSNQNDSEKDKYIDIPQKDEIIDLTKKKTTGTNRNIPIKKN